MNICEEAIKAWPDGAAREYLDSQSPDDEEVKWVVMDESGLYGYIDSQGLEFACADDDDIRAMGIAQFLIRNGGSYTAGLQN